MNQKSIWRLRMAMYTCRGCGAQVAYKDKYEKCPVCGIRWG